MIKKTILAAFGVFTLSFASFATMSALTEAQAQKNGKAPLILVVHQAQLIAQSKAGKSMAEQAESLQDSIRSELTDERKKLDTDLEAYQKNRDLWSAEERQKKEQELQARAQVGLPQMGKVMEQAFLQAVGKAENNILTEAGPIMQKIVEDRGATILIDRSAIMYAAAETDITQEVISKLDKKLKPSFITSLSVPVVSAAMVGKKSTTLTSPFSLTFVRVTPAPEITNGTRTPPSNKLPFWCPSKKESLSRTLLGVPLSPITIMIVLSRVAGSIELSKRPSSVSSVSMDER